MFQQHKILSIVSFYMQLIVETIGLNNKLKYMLMDKTNPIDWMKSIYESYSITRRLILMNEK
jgi:hypothetical protein